jgi:thioredoxin-related protein
MKPTVERLALERNYDVRIIDTQARPEVAEKFAIMGTPTWVLEDDEGSELRRAVGAITRPNLIKFVEGI